MARPLRIEFAGALYHVTARGNAQQDIYDNDADRQQFLTLLQRHSKKTLEQVGEHFGVSYATVSRAVRQIEGRG